VFAIADWCRKYDVKFKINTGETHDTLGDWLRLQAYALTHTTPLMCACASVSVVNSKNHLEDMADAINHLNPIRWKIFQCLEVEGENKQGIGKKGQHSCCLNSSAHFRFSLT